MEEDAKREREEEEEEEALFRHIPHPKKKKFLSLYTKVGDVSKAAIGAGIHRDSHYYWLKTDPAYQAAYEGPAKEILADRMEAEMYRRAVRGIEKPVYHKGKKIDVIRQYSDLLLIFGLKGARPEKYIEKVVQEHIGTVHVQHSYAIAVPPDLIDVTPAGGDPKQLSAPGAGAEGEETGRKNDI